MPLSEAVRTKTWEDAKGTFTSPSLIAAPSVEFCIYKKVPGNKKRTDTRQGTIDQDPEFMAFLESLANPIQVKDIEAEYEEADKTESKITSTPLIEYLKEKKANRGKDGSKKGSKNAQSEGGKGKGGSKDDEQSKKKGKGAKDDKNDKPKETVKILTKKAATEQAAEAAKNAANQINSGSGSDAPKSRRAGIAAAARLLQRDLGLSPGSAHRRARQDAAKADAESNPDSKASAANDSSSGVATTAAASERAASPAPSDGGSQTSKANGATVAKSQTSGRRNRGGKNTEKAKPAETAQPAAPSNPPMILKKKLEPEAASTATSPEASNSKPFSTPKAAQNITKTAGGKSGGQKKAPAVSADATRAFVKHANASQGVTSDSLRQAMIAFGEVKGVEIEKRKGFAYVEFADHDSLVKAINASPVTVGETSVQVLERKDKKPANQAPGPSANGGAITEKSEKPSGRGRRGRGGGGGASSSNKNTASEKGPAAAQSVPAPGAGGEEG